MIKSFDDGGSAVLPGASDLPFHVVGSSIASAGGRIVRRFLKDMVSVGDYVHPKLGWKLPVTSERIDRWLTAFQRMRADGVDVEVVTNHSFKAEDCYGLLVDMFRDGDTLFGVHEMRGEAGIDLARRNKNVSIWIRNDLVSGTGVHYGEAIVHSSISQQPIVPGQGDFVEIAADSGQADSAGLYVLGTGSAHKERTMNAEQLAALKKVLGDAGANLTDDNVAETVAAVLKELGQQAENAKNGLATANTELTTLKAKVAELEKATKTDDDDPTKKVDPDVVDELAEGADDRLASLVVEGCISPKVQESLHKILVGDQGDRNVYALSRRATGGKASMARRILEALKDNKPVPVGEATQGQHALSRQTPAGDEDEKDVDPETTKAMIEEAGSGADPEK